LAITEVRIVPPTNIKKFDTLDLLPPAASSCASIRAEAVFASVNLEETQAQPVPFSPTSQIVPSALYQIC
jgi:hypothetical protein